MKRTQWTGGVGVIGGSRGGELALLLGALFRQVSSVVAIAPSHAMWGGYSRSPAWTLNGKGLPYMTFGGLPEVDAAFRHQAGDKSALALTPIFAFGSRKPTSRSTGNYSGRAYQWKDPPHFSDGSSALAS